MSRILLVSPRFDSEFTRGTQGGGVNKKMALMTPLHLATIAALTPDDFQVDIYDESVLEPISGDKDYSKTYDLVGVTGYIAHLPRAKELGALFRRQGIPVVMGGPGVSGSPEDCRDAFDVLLLGESELTWPRFLSEWKKGQHLSEYRQVERPDLTLTPAPDWTTVAPYIDRYAMGGVQTTRGCPFDCEFCDVIHLFGRKPRHKPIETVIEEVLALKKLGIKMIFMCDDDFIGHKKYAKDLLRELGSVNNSLDEPVAFTTQLTIDLAQDEELMELMADANFGQVLVGIESPREASLRETNKLQNLRGDMVDDIRKIQSYGIAVRASLVVGFDSDDSAVIDEHIDLLKRANVVSTNINTMKAYPGTPLWVRLQRENRVVDVSHIYTDAPRVVSNIIPKGMTRTEMLEGYRRLLEFSRDWDGYVERMRGFVDGVTRQPKVARPSGLARVKAIGRGLGFLIKGAVGGDKNLPQKTKESFKELLQHTWKTAPYLVQRVMGITVQHTMDVMLLPYHSKVIQQQVDEDQAGPLALDRDESAGLVPEKFYKKLNKVMPMLHGRLSTEIIYKPAIAEAMTAVVKDFVIRWANGFEDFEDHHMVYLNELCDRHVERWNERAPKPAASETDVLSLERAKSVHFVKGLVVAVEQDLRGASAHAAA
ncbi:MAG: radical SAM protein [Acidobacteria bacterium]|nr:radical SAM protein [Acidobacteriota bacterium]